MALDVKAILQAQRAEFVVAQFAGQIAQRLVAVLGDAFVDVALVYVVVDIHMFIASQI